MQVTDRHELDEVGKGMEGMFEVAIAVKRRNGIETLALDERLSNLSILSRNWKCLIHEVFISSWSSSVSLVFLGKVAYVN